jgi:hypothetical protein
MSPYERRPGCTGKAWGIFAQGEILTGPVAEEGVGGIVVMAVAAAERVPGGIGTHEAMMDVRCLRALIATHRQAGRGEGKDRVLDRG